MTKKTKIPERVTDAKGLIRMRDAVNNCIAAFETDQDSVLVTRYLKANEDKYNTVPLLQRMSSVRKDMALDREWIEKEFVKYWDTISTSDKDNSPKRY